MSKITEIYDALLAELALIFPDKKRLQNVANLEDNPDHLLNNGYGIIVNDGENLDGDFCEITTVRTFGVAFTRESVSTENRTDVFDKTQKELLECIAILDQKICDGSNLGICKIDHMALRNSTGVESIQGEGKRFLGIIKDITITYHEEIL